MTTILLIFILGLSVCLNVLLWIQRREKKRDIEQLTDKLQQLQNNNLQERLFMLTDDRQLRALLEEINKLLDRVQIDEATFQRTKQSMKKMLTNVSHDLKTPLTVVLGYLETIQNKQLQAHELEKYLSKIQLKTEEILRLIHSFFDLARLEANDVDLPLQTIHINEICKEQLLMFYDVIESKGLAVQLDIPNEPCYIYGNEEALQRILENLLSNAIRYGAEGRVIGLSLKKEPQHVIIEVWDCGRGIEVQHQALIFERMYTLDDARSKSFHGSGLGLTITKSLVEKMKGSITLHSIPYEKTVFRLTFKRLTFDEKQNK